LAVYSIQFDLDKPHPGYSISKNPHFDWDRTWVDEDDRCQARSVCLSHYEPGDDFWIDVRRVGFQQFELGD
jgi:hypothetical protein